MQLTEKQLEALAALGANNLTILVTVFDAAVADVANNCIFGELSKEAAKETIERLNDIRQKIKAAIEVRKPKPQATSLV